MYKTSCIGKSTQILRTLFGKINIVTNVIFSTEQRPFCLLWSSIPLNFFKEQWIYSLAVHTSVFCSSFADLRILISCRQKNYAFWRILLLMFTPNIPHISQSCSSLFGNFFSYYSLIWYRGARNIKLSIIKSYC